MNNSKTPPRETISWDETFLEIAATMTKRSKHPRTQIAALIVNSDHRQIGSGYNGLPSDFPDDAADWSPGMTWTNRDWTIHAEENALLQVGLEKARGTTMYVTGAPCPRLKLAETTGKRYQSLIESQAISKQEFDQAEANLAATQAAADLVKAELKDATIEAPFDGVMGNRLISVGQFITKGTSLTFLINQNPMKAEFQIPEKYLSRLKEKQAIEVTVAAYPKEVFKGEVYFIDPQIDAVTRTALVKASVPNDEGKLRVGMFANLDLIVNVREDAIVVPETALIPKGEEVSVFVIDQESKAQPRPVKVGIRMADVVEITSGLKTGEQVITEGFQKIGPGSKVKPRDANQPADQDGASNQKPANDDKDKAPENK